jgi:hypothetical protein
MADKSRAHFDYMWCELYGGPRDGLWCSTGNVSQYGSATISFPDVDGKSHYYVLLTAKKYNPEKGCLEDEKTFYAYAGTNEKTVMDNVIIGHPGCAANNYDPDLEPDWYNWDRD